MVKNREAFNMAGIQTSVLFVVDNIAVEICLLLNGNFNLRSRSGTAYFIEIPLTAITQGPGPQLPT